MTLKIVRLLSLISAFLLIVSASFSNNNNRDSTLIGENIEKAKLSTIDSIETQVKSEAFYFETDRNKLNKYNFAIDSIPMYPDLIYEYRLAELSNKTPIDLSYNKYVKKYIDMYATQRRDQVSKMLGLAQLYFPIFEEKLDKYQLPLEIKYLAIVESALNPNARSKSGAVGLWQFLFNTSKMFDLDITSYIDERSDPYKSTEAACKYLEYLYRIFDDWQLALAAYNGGPGVVRNAISRSGGKTSFWEIRPYLPTETQGYVPAYIAATYIMNYNIEHNIFPEEPLLYFHEIDTVMVKHPIYFNQISAFTGVPIETIKFLNPTYKQNYIPSDTEPMALTLPNDKIDDFLKYEAEIYGLKMSKPIYNGLENAENKSKIIHDVKKGEYFHKIAMHYRCTVEEIIEWNNLSSYNLNAGQRLIIYVNPTYDIFSNSALN
ncbi:MAG TPA: lytic transglycosylase [Bacteroidales bacterium]|nr:MAG: hypothetical protein A2W98_11300 [Bacteroidetes bacterium GWF2_33_38]OFY76675.1 MAG: hypothetical protein A2265_08955 [Bacteroidetes bacterium RIFOXYA12_FULL_33_9]OFY86766.1 MAG: hypothetical protein A2236_10440 [Bacteroidetes bacterium RIFOXYA2_FULL_33_7]HBF88308.1 lytic transglycosylase [Bacteroidales bacterium]